MDAQVGLPPPPPPPPLPGFLSAPTSPNVASPPPPAPPAPMPAPVATTTVTTATTVTQERIWLHPWTPSEMREYASQWSLAGDAGLLRSLEQFSDRLVQRADTIQEHLSQTVTAVKTTHTRVQNCLNEFLTLANNQFIENRVYEDDETLSTTEVKTDDKTNDKNNANNTEAQEKVLQRYVEAIQCALNILDTHFERVDPKLDNGDASMMNDDEDDDVGIALEPIIEPKDPYFYRPLPLLIGTTEFMQDPYVGLGDLLTFADEEDVYGVEHTSKPIDEVLTEESSEYDEDEEKENDEAESAVQVTVAPIVPAGASRPDFSKPTQISLTDDEDDDDDDPFGVGPPKSKFNDFSFNTPIAPSKPTESTAKPPSDDEEDESLFGNTPRKPTVPVAAPAPAPAKTKTFDENSWDDDDDDDEKPKQTNGNENESEDEEPEAKKPSGVSMFGSGGGMSALEAAVAARRRKVEGLPEPEKDADEEEKPKRKTTKVPGDPLSGSSGPVTSNSTSKITAPTPSSSVNKTSKPSIFGASARSDEDDDDEDGIFKGTPIVKPPAASNTKITPAKKEKDLFDEDSEPDDIFSAAQKAPPVKKVEPPVAPLNLTITKPKPVVVDSDEEDFSILTKPVTQKKPVSVPKPPISKTEDESDEDPLFSSASTSIKPAAAPVTNPPTQKVMKDSDTDDESFGITKKPPKGAIQVLPPIKPLTSTKKLSESEEDDPLSVITKKPAEIKPIPSVSTPSTKKVELSGDDDDDAFSAVVKKPVVPPTTTSSTKKVISSDDDGDDFSFPTAKKPTPVAVVSPPKPKVDSNDEDELFPKAKPVKPSTTNAPPPPSSIQKKRNDSADDDGLFGSKPAQPKPTVASVTKVTTSPFVDPLSSGTIKPAEPTPTKKPTVSDSDEEAAPPAPRELNPAALKDGEKVNVKKILGNISIPVGPPKSGGGLIRPKPAPVDEETVVPKKPAVLSSDSEDDPLFSSPTKKPVDKSTKDSPNIPKAFEENVTTKPKPLPSDDLTPDQKMLTIAKNRGEVAPRNRAPRSRPTRRTETTEGTDDLFGVTATTPVVLPSSTPSRPSVPVVEEPIVPVVVPTGSNARSASPLVVKEKKKFSLFESDDSDLDDLLFGSKSKKPTTTTTKPTATTNKTTKTSGKSILSTLDDDDDDFLSRRPVKKSTKPANKDDIFDDDDFDGTKKGSTVNKAKKDWSILDSKDEKSSTNSKSKASSNATRNKVTNDVDDIFG